MTSQTTSQFLRRFVQQAEAYNSSMFRKNVSTETQPIEVLLADVLSNGYRYETPSLVLHSIEHCSLVSIISPHAFTIQLERDRLDAETFLTTMK